MENLEPCLADRRITVRRCDPYTPPLVRESGGADAVLLAAVDAVADETARRMGDVKHSVMWGTFVIYREAQRLNDAFDFYLPMATHSGKQCASEVKKPNGAKS